MNENLPQEDRDDDLDDRYQRATVRDLSRPSETTRRTVLQHAAQMAKEREARPDVPALHNARRTGTRARRWWAIAGTAVAATLAGLFVVPQLQTLRKPAGPASAARVDAVLPQHAGKLDLERKAKKSIATSSAPAEKRARSAVPTDPEMQRRREAPETAADSSRDAAAPLPPPPPQSQSQSPPARAAAPIPQAASALAGAANQSTAETLGNTRRGALTAAIQQGQLADVESLLAQGADPNGRDAEGRTPLRIAVSMGREDIATVLRKAGGKTD